MLHHSPAPGCPRRPSPWELRAWGEQLTGSRKHKDPSDAHTPGQRASAGGKSGALRPRGGCLWK